ncbi:MAG: DUF5320 domain-containing protein [bacterium]|mgnify:CR=1 FL=1|jgi:hypothetical protein|nr:DUF5320 domain-containing protein [Bacillota bacterium]HHW54937.1 DUF5320 domain-containing protein [Bacillota bacterium]
MPGFDGTGPLGEGPLTGGGRGFCIVPYQQPLRYRPYRRPLGLGLRRGWGHRGPW